jgi:uncharacterized protein YdaU (DUF1376 family)
MRQVGWWVDRWRKSTAFTDLSLEEQGAYRNLIDEVYLREDGVIPEESLAKACGDPIAWPRVRAKVLTKMKKVPTGWTNETASDLKNQSKASSMAAELAGRASAKSRRHHESRGDAGRWLPNVEPNDPPNASPNGQPNESPNDRPNENRTPYPYPLPYSVTVSGTDTDDGKKQPASLTAARSWNQEACEDWISAYEGTAPGARITKALRPIVRSVGKTLTVWTGTLGLATIDAAGWKRVRPVWQAFLRETNARYASPEKFAQAFGAFEKRGGRAASGGRMEATRRAFDKFMKGGE